MKSWKKPTNELIDRAYGMMKKQFDHEYFFTRLKNPLWVQPLVERGCFHSPPKMRKLPGGYIQTPVWPELRYLKNVVMDATDEVLEVVKALPETDNPRVYDDILDIALQLHGEQSAKLIDKVLESTEVDYPYSPRFRLAELLKHWTNENQFEAALKFTEVLVPFVADDKDKAKRKLRRKDPTDLDAIVKKMRDTRLKPTPPVSNREYCKILADGVRPLAEKEPYKVSLLLIDAAANMIRLRTHEENLDTDIDYSEYWCERLIKAEGDHDDAKKSLVHTLTFACEKVYEKLPDSVSKLDMTIRQQQWRLFKRLRHHLYAQYPTEMTKPWIQELMREYDGYDKWEYTFEFQRMIRSACENFGRALLPKSELMGIFDCIRSGPSKDDLTQGEFKTRQHRLHRLQFAPFNSVLFGEYEAYFRKLECEAKDKILDDDYPPFKPRVGYVSTRSPRPPEDLANLTDEELLTVINEWEDTPPYFEGNTVIEVNIQGLSRAFQTVFKEQIVPDPKRRRFWMDNRDRIERPIYVERMICAMQGYVETNNFDNLNEWLTFSEWVLSHRDDSEKGIYDRHAGESRESPNWSNSRWAMGDFIRACFRKDVNPPVSAHAQFTTLLDMFCTQFDWRLDQKGTEKKPVDTNMNTPRCRALEALVNFGLWLRRNDRKSDVSEVMTILEKRLSPDAEHLLTRPEYAILGKNYTWLLLLNKAWTAAHKSALFPQDEFPKWLAAFDNFLGYTSLSKETFEIFQEDFIFAIEHLPDIKTQDRPDDTIIEMIGQCLFIFYLEELYPLTGKESLIEAYYKANDDDREQWANLFDYVGHRLWETTGQLDINEKERILRFFEWRFEVGEPVELQQFTYWLKADCLDAQWRLNTYSEILDITKAEDMSITMEVEALCDMLPNHTGKVVECFTKLTKGIGDNNISIFKEEATVILQAGFKSSEDSVRKNAERAHENLLSIGRFDLMELGN